MPASASWPTLMIYPHPHAARASRKLFAALGLACALFMQAAPAPADTFFDNATRPATPAELAPFQAWYEDAHPGVRVPVPMLELKRLEHKAAWRIWGATTDSPARRGIRSLCIVNRTQFVFDTAWRQEGEARQHAWLETKGCTALESAIDIVNRLPDSDIVELLEQQGKLLASARLLFSGNTSCARQRAFHFQLKQIALGNIVPDGEEMAVLVYHDDRGGLAKVWVRRSGAEHTAWNVSCGPLLSTVLPQVVRSAKSN